MRPIVWTMRVLALVVTMMAGLYVSDARAQIKLGPVNLEGEAAAGVRYIIDEPKGSRQAKFQEYRDIQDGLFLEQLQLRFFRPDESYSAELGGANWGRRDQEYSLRGGRLGLWEFGFEWDQTPHLLF